MRRISPAFALAALLLPSTALAQFQHHRMSVNEVLLSSGGDDAVQYVELHDIAVGGEPFQMDYVLHVYDVDGASLGSVALAIDGENPDDDVIDWYVATAAADAEFGPNGQDELTVALPAEGQVCFELSTGTKFSCLAWGCVNNVLTGTTIGLSGRGGAPPDGMSVGRQADGTYTIGSPTPDAANQAGSAEPACPTDPDAGPSDIDAGTGGDIDAGPNDPDAGGSSGDDGGDDDDDSGCGCGVNGGRGAASTLALGALVTLLAFRRRRRA